MRNDGVRGPSGYTPRSLHTPSRFSPMNPLFSLRDGHPPPPSASFRQKGDPRLAPSRPGGPGQERPPSSKT